GGKIDGSGTPPATIQGNLVGTNAAGLAAVPNARHGIQLTQGANGVRIGGAAATARNVISGQSAAVSQGVEITAGCMSNTISGNYIGTDITGTAKIPNGGNGVRITANPSTGTPGTVVGGTTATTGTAPGNLISGNGGDGVLVTGTSNQAVDVTGTQIAGNLIGTDKNGTTALGNTRYGVEIASGANNFNVGGMTVSARNVISGNGNGGIAMTGSATTGVKILGNYI